ncbi:MAG TPA: hypothetical protein VGP17_01770 [Solirubrobacteraceae bacterium]|jgi:hypothetical protein|nr:hypothetical protein [Solirubrobacteraceae bacterium]
MAPRPTERVGFSFAIDRAAQMTWLTMNTLLDALHACPGAEAAPAALAG